MKPQTTPPLQAMLSDFTPDMLRAFGKIIIALADHPKEEWKRILMKAAEKANARI